jgi:hypothetical protein
VAGFVDVDIPTDSQQINKRNFRFVAREPTPIQWGGEMPMAINWFEGGRRISQMTIGLVAVGGALIVVFVEQPDPEFTTYGPSAPWIVAKQPCPASGHIEHLWNFDWGGDDRGVQLCFIALDDGLFPVADANPPPEEIERMKQNSAKWIAENNARAASGEPLLIPPAQPKWYYTANEHSNTFDEYVAKRRSEFGITDELARAAIARKSGALWDDRYRVFNETAPWIAGICGFLWALTWAVGWIIRGFAGVPSGQDFRSAEGRGEPS